MGWGVGGLVRHLADRRVGGREGKGSRARSLLSSGGWAGAADARVEWRLGGARGGGSTEREVCVCVWTRVPRAPDSERVSALPPPLTPPGPERQAGWEGVGAAAARRRRRGPSTLSVTGREGEVEDTRVRNRRREPSNMAMREEGESAAGKRPEESGRNGYVKSCVSPLRPDGGLSVCRWCSWQRLGLARRGLPAAGCRCGWGWLGLGLGGGGGALALMLLSVLARRCPDSQLVWSSLHSLQAACAAAFHSLSPLFSICCAFFWLTFYLRKSRRDSSTAWLLALPPCCYLGDFVVVQVVLGEERLLLCRLLAPAAVLGCVGLLTLLSTLKVKQSVLILLFSSVVRLASITSLLALPAALRPLLACGVGMLGAVVAVYFDHLFPRETRRRTAPEEKIPVIKPRRRSSCASLGETSTNYYGGSKMPRRTSLPCISREQVTFCTSQCFV